MTKAATGHIRPLSPLPRAATSAPGGHLLQRDPQTGRRIWPRSADVDEALRDALLLTADAMVVFEFWLADLLVRAWHAVADATRRRRRPAKPPPAVAHGPGD